MVTGFRRAPTQSGVGARPDATYHPAMSWLLLASALLQQAAPSVAAPAPVPAPPPAVRPAPWDPGMHRLFFNWNSARVVGQGLAILDRAVEDYRRNGRVTVQILAGADHSGESAYNLRLSMRRARAIADGLVQRGIPGTAIVLRPVGERQPLVGTPDGLRDPYNRYAEITFPEPTLD